MNQQRVIKLSTTSTVAATDHAKPALCPLCGGSVISDFLRAPDRFHLRRQVFSLVRCDYCTAVWLAHPPTPEEMAQHYSDDYHRVIMKAGETSAPDRWKQQRDLIAKYKQSGTILDIGCSSGSFLGTMDKAKWVLYGIEIARASAESARSATGAEIFVGEATKAPFAPNSFDVITSFDLLEHVYEPQKLLRKVLEWLKPGGIYYAELPNIDSWESRMFGSFWYGLELPRHLFHFSSSSLRYVTDSVGFKQEFIITPRTCYVERSVNYVGAHVCSKLGFHPTAQANLKKRSFPWRAVRKGLRLSLLLPFSHMASWASAGGSMQAVFRKPISTQTEE